MCCFNPHRFCFFLAVEAFDYAGFTFWTRPDSTVGLNGNVFQSDLGAIPRPEICCSSPLPARGSLQAGSSGQAPDYPRKIASENASQLAEGVTH